MKYKTILIDPPWTFQTYSDKGKGRSPEMHYQVMTMDDIKNMDVPSLMDDDCSVFMWVTWPTLPFALEIGKAWGLTYKTCAFLWAKTNVIPKTEPVENDKHWFFGMGYWTRANTEPCLLFTKGKPKRKARNVRQLFVSAVQAHSRKPDGIYNRIEALVDGRYLEMFARRRHNGWFCMGNEIDGLDIREAIRREAENNKLDRG